MRNAPLFLAAIFLLVAGAICRADEALRIVVQREQGDTGTMHYSKSMELQLDGSKPAILKTNIEGGVQAPSEILLHRRINAQSVIVFAYSSWGGGSETLHAILLAHIDDSTVITDHLEMTMQRGTGGLVWSDQGRLYAIEPGRRGGDAQDDFLKSERIHIRNEQIKTLKTAVPAHTATLIPGMFHDIAPYTASPRQKLVRIYINSGHFDLKIDAAKGK